MSRFQGFIESAVERGMESAKPFDLKAMASSTGSVGSLSECIDDLVLECSVEMDMEIEAVEKLVQKHSAGLAPVQDVDGAVIGYMSSEFAS